MEFLIFLLVQIVMPFFLVWFILRARREGEFWMTELFETVRFENITDRQRWGAVEHVQGKLQSKYDVVIYKATSTPAGKDEMIRFAKRRLSLCYTNEQLRAIVFDAGGPIEIGMREQNAGKHLLGIVCREIELAEPLKR